MADVPDRHPSLDPIEPAASNLEARIEQLLLMGLDHYFAARYEQAIHVWTRVLFLDRGHARARAYIERARGALAERQRESDELLHCGLDAFDRGDADAARQFLSTAVERGAPQEEALALLGRLNRLDVAGGRIPAPASDEPSLPARHQTQASAEEAGSVRPSLAIPFALLAVVTTLVAGGLYAVTGWDRVERWVSFGQVERTAVSTRAVVAPLIVPSASEAALARAHALIGKRRLDGLTPLSQDDARAFRAALRVLEVVKIDDPIRAEADRLRADVQRALVASVKQSPPPASAPAGPRERP
jgi:hypothetical protein